MVSMNKELIKRCKERLAKNITVWCDWEGDIIELFNNDETVLENPVTGKLSKPTKEIEQ